MQVFSDGVDITFDPNAEDETLLNDNDATLFRRKESVDLVWKDLTFTVPAKKKKEKKSRKDIASDIPPATDDDVVQPEDLATTASEKVILNSMSGYVNAGSMLAVMGSSGAGKTSLLNLLAGRITTSKGAKATGEVYVNGQPRDYAKFKKLAAYVLQDDDMFAELTVEEQLTYAALLRLPKSMPREKKLNRVQKVIQELGLTNVKDTMIGNQIVRGISGGERKRVNIGTELVTDPALLFCDEPTSGLDSFNALNVMTSLRQLASNGRTIVSTIHQPRSSIFALFDQLCLLSEGRVMYFGPAKDAVPYFAALSFKSPAQFNPADFFLDLLSVDPRSEEREANTKARIHYLGDKFESQSAPLAIEAGIGRDVEAGKVDATGGGDVKLDDTEYQTSWVNEFKVLLGRSYRLASRERASNIVRIGQVMFFAVILGLIWLRNGQSDELTVRASITGVLFFIIINQAFGGVFAVIFSFPLERSVVTRERASSTYRTSAYFLSKTMTDIPKSFLFTLTFSAISYFMIGLRQEVGAFFTFVLVIFLTTFLAESLAIAVSVMTGDAQAAAGIIPVFVILAVLFGGFFIEGESLPGWLSWAEYLSFVFYAFSALGKNQFRGDEFEDVLLEPFNELSIWENVGCLVVILIVFRLIGYLFLQYLRGPKFLKF